MRGRVANQASDMLVMKKTRRKHGRQFREESRRAPRTEHGARGARAEAGAGIRALAALEQHERDDREAQQPVHEN